MRNTSLKKFAFDFANSFVAQKLEGIQTRINEVVEGLNAETKSSAGDKHETGRAMLQLEREKLGGQLLEAEKMEQLMAKISINKESKRIGLGSLVKTNMAYYFISVSAGKCTNGTQVIFCISSLTPIGKLLLGKSAGDTISFNGKQQQILVIC